jgi:ABC-2 type transport system permease protein
MVNWRSKKLGDLLWLANGLVLIVLINLLSSFYFFRIDLTEERRYTIKEPSRQMLAQLEDQVYVEVFLEGDLNAGFTRLQKSIREILDEFRIYSDNKVQFTFTNPRAASGEKAQGEFARDLAAKGIQVLPVVEMKDGERVEKIVFPGALVSYGGREEGVMLFKGNRAENAQEVLNQSIEGIEFELANAIYKLTNDDRKSIAWLTGHGELDSVWTASWRGALQHLYDVQSVDLREAEDLNGYEMAIIAKPIRSFSELDKYKLDQYVMGGGKLLLFLDRMDAHMDSASRNDYFAFPYETGLEDQLFRYGVRINPDLVQDLVAAKYPIVTGMVGNQPQLMQIDWPFFPLLTGRDHVTTRNLDMSISRFTSSMDTVKAVGVTKTPLLFTSGRSRKIVAPVKVGVNDLRELTEDSFSQPAVPVAYLLEGTFTSVYKNRFLPEGASKDTFIEQSKPSKIIVVSDGDLVRNDVNPRNGQVQQLGLDLFSNYTFANQDLVMNFVNYLADENGLINARNKEVKIRPLDKVKVKEKFYWQFINLVLPLALLIGFGLVRAYLRRRTYANFK